MDKNFALGSILTAVVILGVCGTALSMCSISETEYTRSLTACANSGGSYLPTGGNANSYQCINKLNK